MGLNIEYNINLSDPAINIAPLMVNQGAVIAEKDSSLRMYYIHNNTCSDKTSRQDIINYGALAFKDIAKHMTGRSISRLGIKTFPGIGSYGFFKYKYEERSMIMCPINDNKTKFHAPTLTMSLTTNNQLQFTIVKPEDITYLCYRIILRNQQFAIEYITYDDIIVLPKPDVKGSYDIYCLGYVGEGEYISFDSNVQTLKVTAGKDTFEPDKHVSYYTKEQVDELLKNLTKILASDVTFADKETLQHKFDNDTLSRPYTGDSETITVSDTTKVISVNKEYRKIIESGGGGGGSSSAGSVTEFTLGTTNPIIDISVSANNPLSQVNQEDIIIEEE